MIACPLPATLATPLGDVALGCDFGWQAWPVLLLVLAGLAASFLVPPRSRGARPRRRVVPTTLLVLAAAALALAGLSPWLAWLDQAVSPRIVFALDVSDSARRGLAPEEAARRVEGWLAPLGAAAADRALAAADLVLFADGAATTARAVPLGDVPALIRGGGDAARAAGLSGEDSNLAAGLGAAGAALEASGAPGFVVLISDGLETEGDAVAAAVDLARAGTAVHVVPVESPAPGIGLYAAYLPPQVEAGVVAQLRLVLVNDSPTEQPVRLAWSATGGAGSGSAEEILPPGAEVAVRVPLGFTRRGLHHVDVSLAAGEVTQHRRLFTQVIAAPAIAVLGPAPWAAVFEAANYDVVRLPPGAPFDPEEFDLVVIDQVAGDQLAEGQQQRLAEAVTEAGIGLMIVNGRHRAAGSVPVLLASYEHGALDRLLPLTTQPRKEMVEPPGGDITIIIDTSGSMGGWPLDASKEVASFIVDQLVARDRATVMSFADADLLHVDALAMDKAGRESAKRAIGGLTIGGGTNPVGAIERAARRAKPPCGLFFISDGIFNQALRQPGCMTTVFDIGGNGNIEAAKLGQVVVVQQGFQANSLVLAFFNPQPRPRSFEPGAFVPDDLDPTAGLLPQPPLPLEGTAVTYARASAELVGMRPWPLDPVLAFQPAGLGEVAVFTTEVPSEWASSPAGAEAILAWADRLVGWSERDRHVVSASERDGRLILSVGLTAGGEDGLSPPPRVDAVSAELIDSAGRSEPIRFAADPELWGVFAAETDLPPPSATDEGRRRGAMLVLRETGPGAGGGPQRIPVELPETRAPVSAAEGAEAWSFGLAADRLETIAAAGAGRWGLRDAEALLARERPMAPPEPLWPWLMALAAAAYVIVIAEGRLAR